MALSAIQQGCRAAGRAVACPLACGLVPWMDAAEASVRFAMAPPPARCPPPYSCPSGGKRPEPLTGWSSCQQPSTIVACPRLLHAADNGAPPCAAAVPGGDRDV